MHACRRPCEAAAATMLLVRRPPPTTLASCPTLQALDEVRAREVAIVELQKRVADGEARLKQQQVGSRRHGPPPLWTALLGMQGREHACSLDTGPLPAAQPSARPAPCPHPRHLAPRCPAAPPAQALYEAVRTDRNLYSKNLIEAQDEISELKRKFKIQAHQVRAG